MTDLYCLLQVDGPEEIPDPEDPSKFTSVGVQVEDDRGWGILVSLSVIFSFSFVTSNTIYNLAFDI